MREGRNRGDRIHDRVWELLPWYVNATLGERERESVESHLAACRRCAEEERACRRAAEAVQAAGEIAPSPHPVQFQRLLARIEESEREERLGGGWRGLGASWRAVVSAHPRGLRLALAAPAAVIAMLLGALVWQRPPAAPAVYRTLAASAPAPAPAVRLRVMFAPQATEREIRALLQAVRGEITAGPSPLGVYTVEVPAAGDPVEVVLARLRTEPQVAFAERAAGEAAAGGSR